MEEYEYIIIGSGPAGLQLGHDFKQKERSYVILEKIDKVAGFTRQFPKHRKLISYNKGHTLFSEKSYNRRYDWNSLLCDDPSLDFINYSTDILPSANILVTYLEDFAKKYKLNIVYNTEFVGYEKQDNKFIVKVKCTKDCPKMGKTVTDKAYKCDVLILATGGHTEIDRKSTV